LYGWLLPVFQVPVLPELNQFEVIAYPGGTTVSITNEGSYAATNHSHFYLFHLYQLLFLYFFSKAASKAMSD